MNGVAVESQAPLSFAREADAVIVGSGTGTRELVRDAELMAELRLDPSRQIIGAQCSGALVLAKLGLLGGVPACTDSKTRPWVEEAGVRVLDQPFIAHGNVATAGGCLGSHYLAAWMIARLAGFELRQPHNDIDLETTRFDVHQRKSGQQRRWLKAKAALEESWRAERAQLPWLTPPAQR